MARIRTVKPEFWTSEQVMEVSPLARLLFIGMWNFCDDKGVIPASFKTLKAQVFPSDDILAADVERLIGELIAQELLVQFDADGRSWWFVTGWHHQVINRPSKSRYPSPPCQSAPLPEAAGQDDSVNDATQNDESATRKAKKNRGGSVSKQGELTEQSMSTHGALTDGREGKGKERNTLSQLPDGSFEREGRALDRDAGPPTATTAPADLTPTPAHRGIALNANLDLQNELAMFLANARSKGTLSADWNAAFEVWLRRSRNFGNGKDQRSRPASTAASSLSDQNRAAAERAKVLLFGNGAPAERDITP